MDRLCPMLPQNRKPEWQWLQANGATVVDMDLHMKRLSQLVFGRSCHNLLEPLWSSFGFRTWLAGLPGKCMIKPLIDATGPAMCMTFMFASLWMTDVDERRLGRSSMRLPEMFMTDTADAVALHIWRMLMTYPSSVHPEATSSDGNIPLGRLFFDMPVGGRIMDVHQQSSRWDTILLNNLGQQMAPLILWFLVHFCGRSVHASRSSTQIHWHSVHDCKGMSWKFRQGVVCSNLRRRPRRIPHRE